jgi:glutamate synthase domain-containing protein 3
MTNPGLAAALSRMTPEERKLRAEIAAHTSWANTEDRAARTAKARAAFDERFYVGIPDDLAPAEREKRAANARKAYYTQMRLKAATAARKRRERNGGDGT